MKQEKISVLQAVVLMTCYIIGLSMGENPAKAGSDLWISLLIGWAGGYVVVLVIASLAALHPGCSLVGILTDCLGRTAGRIVALCCAAAFLLMAGGGIQQFGLYEITIEIPETPSLFIDICYALVIAYAAKIGLEALGRMSEVFFPILCIIVLVTLASLFTSFHTEVFLPVLKNGWRKPLMEGIRITMLPFAGMVAGLTVFPNLNEPKKIFRVANLISLIAGITICVIILRNIFVTGIQLASRNLFPYEKVFRLMPGIDVYPLLDLDVMVTGILTGGVLIFAAVRTIGEVFGLRQFKILVFPATALAVSGSQIYLTSTYRQIAFSDFMALRLLPALFALCVVLLVISLVRPARAAVQPAP